MTACVIKIDMPCHLKSNSAIELIQACSTHTTCTCTIHCYLNFEITFIRIRRQIQYHNLKYRADVRTCSRGKVISGAENASLRQMTGIVTIKSHEMRKIFTGGLTVRTSRAARGVCVRAPTVSRASSTSLRWNTRYGHNMPRATPNTKLWVIVDIFYGFSQTCID